MGDRGIAGPKGMDGPMVSQFQHFWKAKTIKSINRYEGLIKSREN